MSGIKIGWIVWALLLVLSACGRIGVHLIPARDRPDAGASFDSGTGAADGGGSMPDGGLLDGGGMGGGLPDGGGLDGMVASCSASAASCQNDHGAAVCSAGTCMLSCSIGYQNCDGDTANGCEMSTLDSVSSCGICGRSCVNAHGTASCSEGLCAPACTAGFADCDNDAANGCETDLTQMASCGTCTHACGNSHGTTACTGGQCNPSCASGFGNCDGSLENGCETDVNDDPMHCGSCTKVCNLGEICAAGVCQPSSCPVGQGECDSNPAVSCETDLTSSPANCGFCGNDCQVANGTPSCSMSTCGIAGCNAGYADCDTTFSNGCEVPLATSTTNCGNCATACSNAHGSTSCVSSACAPSCSAGWGDCDASRPNGCETALNTVSNCGMCGNVCAPNGGTPQCNSGVCTTVCDLNGMFGLKLSVPATWPSTSVLSSGSGTFLLWARVQLSQSGTSLTGNVVPCGQVLPDFSAAASIGEKYGMTYPNTIFDRVPPVPSVATTGTLGGTSPGSTFSLGRAAWMLGVTMTDPLNGAWPNFASTMQQDADGDGKAAVSLPYKSGSGYSLAPASASGTPRADLGYIASRIVFTLGGTLTSCTQASGSATAQDIDYHTLGCRVSPGGGDCTSTQGMYLDSNGPNYSTGASTYTLVKLANTAVCSDVRAALP